MPSSESEKPTEQHTPSFAAPEVPKPAPQQQQSAAPLEAKTFQLLSNDIDVI